MRALAELIMPNIVTEKIQMRGLEIALSSSGARTLLSFVVETTTTKLLIWDNGAH